MSSAVDHRMSAEAARELMGVPLLPREVRVQALAHLVKERGVPFVIEALADLIGLANQAQANTAAAVNEFVASYGIEVPEGFLGELNLPTLYGALQGVVMAAGVEQAGLCAGCAYRGGSRANQCHATTTDAQTAAVRGIAFMCHAGVDEVDESDRVCVGWARKEGRAR